jgi:hypothetical protein
MLRDEFADGWHEFARNDHDSLTGRSRGRLILSERCVLRLRVVVIEDSLDAVSVPAWRKPLRHCANAYATGLAIGPREPLARRASMGAVSKATTSPRLSSSVISRST